MNALARACIAPLMGLGFTEIESAAYTFLVQHSPATGYRIAHGIGKPVANTYKAIRSLRSRGAVIVDETARQQCRAVPPAEVFATLERRRRAQCDDALDALTRLRPAEDDDGVYALSSREQTFERFREMLERAGEVALIDIFPEPLATLREPIERAAARGLLVAVKVYAPTRLRGVEVVLTPHAPRVRKRWPGQWLTLAVDGAEHLIAFFGERDSQAMWSASPQLSWVYHGGLWAEMVASRLTDALNKGASPAALKRIRSRMDRYVSRDVRGYKQLRRRLVAPRGRSRSAPGGR